MNAIEFFKLAHKLNEDNKFILLKEKVHFRASLNSVSLISISSEKPELGIKCNVNKYQETDIISGILSKDINKIMIKPAPKRLTPEKELQSWIINYALNNNNSLPFDENIKFITSELAISNHEGKKIVTDILGYNERLEQLCIIELKSERLRKRLIDQVNNFENVILENPDFFTQLLLINGFNNPKIISKNITKIVVWPYKRVSPDKILRELNIVEFTYKEGYSFSNFNQL